MDSGLRSLTEEGIIKKKTRDGETGSPALPPLPVVSGSGPSSVMAPGPIKMSNSARSTKHGSFDFERPGWSGALMIQRSGSGGTNGSTVWEKERAPNLGTLQREERYSRGRKTLPIDKERTMDSDQQHASTSTKGKTSSLSKATGKRFSPLRESVGGLSRPAGAGHLGLFSFEPAVPALNSWSTGAGTSSRDRVGSADIRKEYERVERERERQREKEKEGRRRRVGGDRPAVPVPLPFRGNVTTIKHSTDSSFFVGSSHRSGTKGRSLDLGLGLAWASSKVPEKALLPSSTFMVRMTPGHGSLSVNGHSSVAGSGVDEDEERSKLGREIAEEFKNVLDEEGYKLFRQCLSFNLTKFCELTLLSDVHQFDAHKIPFDGPNGIVSLVEMLLISSSNTSAPTSTSTTGRKTGLTKRMTASVRKSHNQNQKQGIGKEDRQRLLDKFVRIILQQA